MIAGVDIGGTKIAVGIIDDCGKILCQRETPTGADGSYRNAISRVIQMLRTIAGEVGVKITGIGIGSTGPVYPLTGEIGDVNFFPHWRGENPVNDLRDAFGVSAAIENDADAAALGELAWGAGSGKTRLIYVTVGTGIGVSLVIDGRIYRGVAHSHPEIGHHLLDASGPPCSCGFNGCWESFAAGPAMTAWMVANIPDDYPYRVNLSAKIICELAQADDHWAKLAVQREARYLGMGISNLITLFVPDGILLGGSVMNSAFLFMDTIRDTVKNSCRYVPYQQTEIRLASLGVNSNLIGAAGVWYHRFSPLGRNRDAA
jgi:glucokinase